MFNIPIRIPRHQLQSCAYAFMFVDHIAVGFSLDEPLLRAVGRFAFPLFILLLIDGFYRTSNLSRYFFRLITFGVASQIPYILFFESFRLNIFFTLAASLLLFSVLSEDRPLFSKLPLLAILLFIFQFCEFRTYGFCVSLLLFIRPIGGSVLWYLSWLLIHMLVPFQLPAFLVGFCVPGKSSVRTSARVHYFIYPVHLLLFTLFKV